MQNSWKGVIYILGIIAAIYLIFKYLLPLITTILSAVLQIIMWVAIAILIIILVGYIIKLVRNR